MKTFTFTIIRILAAKKQTLFTLFLALVASVGTTFAEVVKIDNINYYLNHADRTAKIVASTNSVLDLDWNVLPAAYVASDTCPNDPLEGGLKSVMVYADEQYINILLEPNMEDIQDSSFILSIFLDIDNSSQTGGILRWLFADPCNWLLEDTVFVDGNLHSFSPSVAKWDGESVSDEWSWKYIGEVVMGTSRMVDNKFEIKIERDLIPIPTRWTQEFGIGFELTSLDWMELGRLPMVSLDDYLNGIITAPKLKVKTYDYNRTYNYTQNNVSGDLIIPSSVNYNDIAYTVTRIGQYAFSGRSGLTSVTIPNSVTSIGEHAFVGCGLTSINLPNSVKSIGYEAFMGCYSLTSVKLPDSVIVIAPGVFWMCRNLTSITIPQSVISIGMNAFDQCHGLTSVLWNAKKSVDYELTIHPFGYSRPQITSFTFGDDVEIIPAYLCSNMSNLDSIIVPNSVTSIGENAFYACSNITSIKIPSIIENSVCRISDLQSEQITQVESPSWFYDVNESNWPSCPKHIQEVTVNSGELNDNVLGVIQRSYKTLQSLNVASVSNTLLTDEAFKGFYNLRSLVLPSELTNIGYMAVAECKNLQSIDIPASVEEIEQSAFENCRSLTTISFAENAALSKIGSWAFYNCHQLTQISIPEGVTEIGNAAFYGCVYVQSLQIPSSVQSVGDNALALCSRISRMDVDAVSPPAVEDKTFFEVSTVAPVYVPDESVNVYKAHPIWGRLNIIGKSNAPTAIENVTSSSLQGGDRGRLILRDGQILILRGDKTYTITGQEVR